MTASSLGAPHPAYVFPSKSFTELMFALFKESQKYLSSQYAKDEDSWGVMKDSVWDNYTDFMYETGLISQKIDAKDQYTNEFVK